MICKVKRTIEKYDLLSQVKTVAVGVSGGADSMCLLSILGSLKEEYGIIIKAVHLNHNLRGEEAKRDESFVREYCALHGIELAVFSEDIAALSKKTGMGEEECGRMIRYRVFGEMNCDAVATAHSLSDSIETLLFNLSRGTALKGLCGIPAKREPNIIRPLIECTRKEIEDYCEKNHVPYITDSSNLSDDYMRNHIRHNLIPDISKINEGYENNIARCISSLSEDDDFLTRESEKLLKESKTDEGYKPSVLKKAHPAVRKRALAHILKSNMNKSTENRHVELFNEIVMKSGGKIEIGTDLYISVKGDIIFFQQRCEADGKWISEFIGDRTETPYGVYRLCSSDKKEANAIDADKLHDKLYLSSRMQGDSFTFRKRGMTKSLKKLFNEMKIPQENRNRIPVLHDGQNVVWVENVGVNAFYTPDEKTKNIIIIKREG
ncbi:MAG: tRNA lysidine(34) synthetase TilS [Clostridia bacterium]|nr:tRNA lysidine(34) synthetase TilS [Clostridia bacterium]